MRRCYKYERKSKKIRKGYKEKIKRKMETRCRGTHQSDERIKRQHYQQLTKGRREIRSSSSCNISFSAILPRNLTHFRLRSHRSTSAMTSLCPVSQNFRLHNTHKSLPIFLPPLYPS